jgi:hypothetical protein
MSLPESFKTQIENLAFDLAEVMSESTAAGAVLDAAEGHRDNVAARVAALAEEREAIIKRRGGGYRDDTDGAALALIQVDSDGLQSILQEASARVEEAEAARAALSNRAAHLRQEIAHVEALAYREALIRHADLLSERLLETLNSIAAVNRQTGHTGRPEWGPPPDLYQVLRKIAAQRGEL